MKNLEILDEEIFKLPKERNIEYFPEYLHILFDQYKSVIQRFEGELAEKVKAKYHLVEGLCNSILNTVEIYLNGEPAKAYYELEQKLNEIQEHLNISRDGVQIGFGPKYLYRMRSSNQQLNRLSKREEVFHVPFHIRDNISTMRYSIPGYPCLYLSNSTYLCWEELGRPDMDKVYVSRFSLKESELKFLDLSMSTSQFIRMNKALIEHQLENNDLALFFLFTWPLQAACSIKVLNRDAVFKPEYIIPQLVLQWVKQNREIFGIKYFSTRVNYDAPINRYTNYAIPVKHISGRGYCSVLKASIKLSEPISLQTLHVLHPEILLSKASKEDFNEWVETNNMSGNYSLDMTHLELIKGYNQFYLDTTFGKLELMLLKLPLENIK